MKKTKKAIEPIKSKFYTLDTTKPIVAEGYRSAFPWVFLLFALFFCAIFAFIIIANKNNGSFDENADTYKLFCILCGCLLGVASFIFIAYIIRNTLVRKRIAAAYITRATIVFVSVSLSETRDKDGDIRRKETVDLTYSFYDELGNVRSDHFRKTYGKAPDFYEGQQLVVAFDETKCFILSKYTLLDDDFTDNNKSPIDSSDADELFGKQIDIDVGKYTPLGYDKRYYLAALIFLGFTVSFAILMIYYSITVKDIYVWAYVGIFGLMFTVFLIMTLNAALLPFLTKRKYDHIIFNGASFTIGKLESSAKTYGNGVKAKYLCKYIDSNGNERSFRLRASLAKKFVRYGDTEIVVAYANDKAIALIKNSDII